MCYHAPVKPLTPHQLLVSRVLEDLSREIEPAFHQAFMMAMCLALRQNGVPVSLISRDVRLSPLYKDCPRRLFALVIDQKPVGLRGSVGWKAIGQAAVDEIPKGGKEGEVIYTQSTNHASRWPEPMMRKNLVVQALLSKSVAHVESWVLGRKTEIVERRAPTPRL